MQIYINFDKVVFAPVAERCVISMSRDFSACISSWRPKPGHTNVALGTGRSRYVSSCTENMNCSQSINQIGARVLIVKLHQCNNQSNRSQSAHCEILSV
jgi:hypothetical protein